MALDKQRILSELGSVMNQLKSADCGCMGKIFSNNENNPQNFGNNYALNHGNYQKNCCHNHNSCNSHGHSCINPYSGNMSHSGPQSYNRPCFGQCDPPKLYADTYSYLNEKLMQPVVKEVYHDLKSISPTNTVVNNPLASQVGLPLQTGASPMSNMPQNMPNPNVTAQKMAGMGPDIVNMFMGSSDNKPKIHENPPTGQMSGIPSSCQGTQQSINGPTGMGDASQLQYTNNLNQNQPNMYQNFIPNNNNINQFQQIAAPQVSNNPPNPIIPQIPRHQTGTHDKGIAKFNEMFPGVMQGLGGDLNFDPMAIAIQMNPENQQKVAMEAMHKAFVDNTPKSMNQQPIAAVPEQFLQPVNNLLPANQPQELPKQNIENNIDFSKNAGNILRQDEIGQPKNNKEPIFPVDTSKHGENRGYNTLGQPVDMFPAKMFHAPVQNLPQTLAPQPTAMKYKNETNLNNVKHTISKTSLIGRRSMTKTPSRSQMQHIYNQYRGSQSYTQQNIQEHPNVGTASVGRLQTAQANTYRQGPIEKEGGDIARSKTLETKKYGTALEQSGDAPNANMDRIPEKIQITKSPKCRNGLQDMVYTSYPTSTAWSFHGNRGPTLATHQRYKTRF